VIEQMLAQFPFEILGFHADNGSEYVNHRVAKMLDKLKVEFTRSRRFCCNSGMRPRRPGVVRLTPVVAERECGRPPRTRSERIRRSASLAPTSPSRGLAMQRKRNTLMSMKSAVIPQVRVEPELRAELEAVLHQGETLSEFVEASVRNAVEFRRVQTRFHERGQASWEHYERTGVSFSADEILSNLQTKLDAKRKQLGR
jgi:hypothetical protein